MQEMRGNDPEIKELREQVLAIVQVSKTHLYHLPTKHNSSNICTIKAQITLKRPSPNNMLEKPPPYVYR